MRFESHHKPGSGGAEYMVKNQEWVKVLTTPVVMPVKSCIKAEGLC